MSDELDLRKAQNALRAIRQHVDAAERVLQLLPAVPDGVDVDSLQVWIGTRDQWRTMLAEVKRPLREALAPFAAIADHLTAYGNVELLHAWNMKPGERVELRLSDCKRAKEVLGG